MGSGRKAKKDAEETAGTHFVLYVWNHSPWYKSEIARRKRNAALEAKHVRTVNMRIQRKNIERALTGKPPIPLRQPLPVILPEKHTYVAVVRGDNGIKKLPNAGIMISISAGLPPIAEVVQYLEQALKRSDFGFLRNPKYSPNGFPVYRVTGNSSYLMRHEHEMLERMLRRLSIGIREGSGIDDLFPPAAKDAPLVVLSSTRKGDIYVTIFNSKSDATLKAIGKPVWQSQAREDNVGFRVDLLLEEFLKRERIEYWEKTSAAGALKRYELRNPDRIVDERYVANLAAGLEKLLKPSTP